MERTHQSDPRLGDTEGRDRVSDLSHGVTMQGWRVRIWRRLRWHGEVYHSGYGYALTSTWTKRGVVTRTNTLIHKLYEDAA